MSNRYLHLAGRQLIAISGEETRPFLQGLITQDINSVTAEQSAYGALLSAQGKFLYDFFLLEREGDIWLDCDRGKAAEFLRLLQLYRLRAKVTIRTVEDYHVLVALGDISALSLPLSPGRTERFEGGKVAAMADPRMIEMGARIVAPASTGENWLELRGFAHTTEADYTHRRLTLGVPDGSADLMSGKSLLLENGIDRLNGVSFTKGCYIGQEVTARTKHRAELRKQLYCVRSGGEPLPPAGTPVMLDERVMGEMRSSLEDTGLALLRHEAVESGGELVAGGVELRASLPVWAK